MVTSPRAICAPICDRVGAPGSPLNHTSNRWPLAASGTNRTSFSTKDGLGALDIILDLLLERLRAFEPALIPQPVDELDGDRLAVQLSHLREEVGLDHRAGSAKRWRVADRCDPSDPPILDPCTGHVDPVGGNRLGLGPHIRRGKSKTPPSTGAPRHATANDVSPAQKTTRQGDVSVGHRSTDAARVYDDVSDVDRADHLNREPIATSSLDQPFDVPGPVSSEVKIVANDQLLRVENLDQKAADELVGFDLRERARERLHHGRIHPTSRQRGEPVAKVHQQPGSGFGPEHRDRMGFERQRDTCDAAKVCVLAYVPQNDLVPTMNSVKVADRDHRTAELAASALQVPDDPHGRCDGAVQVPICLSSR